MSDSLSNFLVPRNIWNPSHMRFFCHFYRMLIILFVLVYTLSSFIDTFQSEHQRCSVSKPNISFHPSFACEDLPYVLYFRSLIESSSTILQYRLIAKRVLSMYSDLSKNLIPLTLDLNYIRKNLPRYYSSLSNSTNSDQRMLSIHPISFGIPEDKIAIQVPPKNKTFSTVIPGDKTTYVDDETIYYQELQKSIFTFTYKKAGWDCLRHNEILSAGSLPLFVNVERCPKSTLAMHPKKLYRLLLKIPGLEVDAQRRGSQLYKFTKLRMPVRQIDSSFVHAMTSAFLHYTKNVLSTKVLAQYVLSTMQTLSLGRIQTNVPLSILFLTHDSSGDDDDFPKGDYMVDLLLHGFKQLLGHRSVVDYPRRDCLYKRNDHFTAAGYFSAKTKLYGQGFGYAFKLDELSRTTERTTNQTKKNIERHRYDLVIVGSAHRNNNKLQHWDLICRHYNRLEVGIIDGGDVPISEKIIEKYAPCASHIFSREGYAMQ